MKTLKIIAVRYLVSKIVEMQEFESIRDGLGTVNEMNHEDVMVGYEPSWTVYIVEGSSWYRIEDDGREYSGVRYDFIEFLEKEHGGHLHNFYAPNFRAVDREDF